MPNAQARRLSFQRSPWGQLSVSLAEVLEPGFSDPVLWLECRCCPAEGCGQGRPSGPLGLPSCPRAALRTPALPTSCSNLKVTQQRKQTVEQRALAPTPLDPPQDGDRVKDVPTHDTNRVAPAGRLCVHRGVGWGTGREKLSRRPQRKEVLFGMWQVPQGRAAASNQYGPLQLLGSRQPCGDEEAGVASA